MHNLAHSVNTQYHGLMIQPYYHSKSHQPDMNLAVAQFVARGLNRGVDIFDKFATMGVARGDDLIGGTVFHSYIPEAGVMELSSYSKDPRWMTPRVIKHMFHFPFCLCNCQMVFLRVSDKNNRMNRIAKRFGFSSVHIPRMRGLNEGEILHTFTKEQWQAHHLNCNCSGGIVPG